MTSTYVISDQLGKDFKRYCSSLGLSPAKVLRRLIASCVLTPQKIPNLSNPDFLTSIASKYSFKDM